MKLQRFLDCVQTELLNRPEVHIPTLKLFISKFMKCLSKNEKHRNQLQLQMIMEFTKGQITIKEFVRRETAEKLENELVTLKNEVKPK